jgi:DNA modification methylase
MTDTTSPTVETRLHPAKWSAPILTALGRYVFPDPDAWTGRTIVDPFAGRGLPDLSALAPAARWVGIELEPEWAAQGGPGTIVGDARRLPFPGGAVDAVVTSPCYGNRMADTYLGGGTCRACEGTGAVSDEPCGRCKGAGRDRSRRMTYAAALGRIPSPGSAAAMQWGREYRAFHRSVWAEARRALRPGGTIVVNVSNHIRAGKVQHVAEWHLDCLASLGFTLRRVIPVETRRMKFGENHDARVPTEMIFVLERP